MTNWKLYTRYTAMNVKGTLQYSTWPISILTTAVNSTVDFLGMMILFRRFGTIGTWTSYHVLLLYGLASTSFGFAEWLSRGYDIFPWHVSSGSFDRILLRPRNTFLQVMGQKFEFQRFGRTAVGLGCTVYAIINLGSKLNILTIGALLGAILGGWFVYTGIFMMLSALSFWTMQPLDIMYIFTNATLQYAQIPLPLLGRTVQRFLTFVLPLGLCYYYPAMLLSGALDYPAWVGFMALPGGILFFLLSLFIWMFGVRHYHSSGS
jgi:ABC-2 type transport system permease protein